MVGLAELRRSRGYSQRTLAKAARVSPSTIYALESGTHSAPHPSTAKKLADAMGVDVSDVLGAVQDPKAQAPPSLTQAEASGEERRETKAMRPVVSPEELKQHIAFMKRVQEEREREIAKVEAQEWEGNIKVWIFDVEAAEQRLANFYELEGISDYVEGVNQGEQMAPDEVRLLCQDFAREFDALRHLTNKAKVAAQTAESKTFYQGVHLGSEVEAFAREQEKRESH